MTAARIDRPEFAALTPGVSEALIALGKAVNASGLPKDLQELIKIRASQLNGCAFCLQFHLNVARDLQVPAAKLDLLATWREAPVYSERERLALAWTEALTLAPQGGADDALYERALAEFGAATLSFLTAAVAGINAWNRIAMALRFSPPLRPGA
ncbi:carboxymuconolactone decarboxylase family protein [Paucibacter sp. O1-1]|uniref:carboxymuconolactone decarboxylase family protein n=1 Tax=Paucibacter sp. XJ19-41 TaxID=2927824 RepID=UPI0021D4B6E4|nr:carboxymuconolactone decarboxylase family protein [Paucibacter sp. XJ19-41]MCU7371128.1 carboxymuconolactone decarboxylase family protein [Paucibacter sp. O1-1]MDA3826116.1 carboxymuconolactone decarboxylase family protein [Paucibacter sp. O1-1]MDC6166928.1 carboxymuconolactone decarboxylase family protein [Paucibacter sp. XJ19-41]